MKAIKIILTALLVIAALLLVLAAILPSKVTVRNQVAITAHPQLLFQQVNCLQNWEKWSPFEASDMTSYYDGKPAGKDSKRRWVSDSMGNGTLTILASTPYDSIAAILEMEDGMSGNIYFTFKPETEGNVVTWDYEFINLSYPVGRLFGMMVKGLMGPVFQKGLDTLKAYTERLDKYSMIQEVEVPSFPIVYITDSCTIDLMSQRMGENYEKLVEYIISNNAEITGYPLSYYLTWNPGGYTTFTAAIPVNKLPESTQDIQVRMTSPCKAVRYTYFGGYESLDVPHNAIDKYIFDSGNQVLGAPWEEYITDPTTEPDSSKWQTNIYYPVLF
jgi:effector-binding domain-containing protein